MHNIPGQLSLRELTISVQELQLFMMGGMGTDTHNPTDMATIACKIISDIHTASSNYEDDHSVPWSTETTAEVMLKK